MKHTSRAGTSALVGLLRKEIYHILRDRRTLFVIAFLPVVQLVIFGYAIRTDVTEARLPSDGPGQLTNSRAPDLAQPGSAEVRAGIWGVVRPMVRGASPIHATSGAITAEASAPTPRRVFEANGRWFSRPR